MEILPDDGIIDHVAVRVAAEGIRRVALTETEREMAAQRIVESGGGVREMISRLGYPVRDASRTWRKLVADGHQPVEAQLTRSAVRGHTTEVNHVAA